MAGPGTRQELVCLGECESLGADLGWLWYQHLLSVSLSCLG